MTSAGAAQQPHDGEARYESITIQRSIEVNGRTYQADMPAMRRRDDDEIVTNLADERDWRTWVARQVARSGDNSPEAFRFLRETVSPKAARFARDLGVSAATLSRWENGTHAPNPFVFALLRAAALEYGAWQRLVRKAMALHAAEGGGELEPLIRVETRWHPDDSGHLHCTAEAFMPGDTEPAARVTLQLEHRSGPVDGSAELELADQAAGIVHAQLLRDWHKLRIRDLHRVNPNMTADEMAKRLNISPEEVHRLAKSAGVRLPPPNSLDRKRIQERRSVQEGRSDAT